MGFSRPLKILVLSTFHRRSVNVLRDYLFSFQAYSRHQYYYVFNYERLGRDIDFGSFDVILFFWGVYLPWIVPDMRRRIAEAAARKVVFLQDEYREVRSFNEAMSELGVNVMFTCVAESQHQLFYPTSLIPTLEATYTVLTGYVPSYLESSGPNTERERPLDIAYRSREVPYYLGDLGRQKTIIATRFQEIAGARGLRADISVREEDRLYGDEWVRFLRRSRSVLGSPSGASVVDFSGEIQRDCERYLAANPAASYEEVRTKFFADVDGRVTIETLSPRAFEAAALGCTLVHLEGSYAGVLEADRHYIRVKRDYSNLGEVVDRIEDRAFCRQLAEWSHAELIASGRYSYRTFVREFDRRLDQHAPRPVRVRSMSRSRFYGGRYVRHAQRMVPLGGRFVSLPALPALLDRIRRLRFLLLTIPKGMLAVRVTLANPALRGLLYCYWVTPAVRSRVRIAKLLNDLLKLEVVQRAQDGTLQSREPFRLTGTVDGTGVLTLRSVASRSTTVATHTRAAAEVEWTSLAGKIRLVIWDHSALGPQVVWALRRGRWTTLGLGPDGVYRFEAVAELCQRAPERGVPYLLAILGAGSPTAGVAPAQVERA